MRKKHYIKKAFVGGQLITGRHTKAIQDSLVMIDNGGFIYAGERNYDMAPFLDDFEIVDCTGKTLMPGIIEQDRDAVGCTHTDAEIPLGGKDGIDVLQLAGLGDECHMVAMCLMGHDEALLANAQPLGQKPAILRVAPLVEAIVAEVGHGGRLAVID